MKFITIRVNATPIGWFYTKRVNGASIGLGSLKKKEIIDQNQVKRKSYAALDIERARFASILCVSSGRHPLLTNGSSLALACFQNVSNPHFVPMRRAFSGLTRRSFAWATPEVAAGIYLLLHGR